MYNSIDEALRNAKKIDVPISTLEKVDDVLVSLKNRKVENNSMNTNNNINRENSERYRRSNFRFMKALVAAVICIVIGLSATVLAANFLGLRDMVLPNPQPAPPTEESNNVYQGDTVSEAGVANTDDLVTGENAESNLHDRIGTIRDALDERATMQNIALQGFAGSPEHAAAVEWQNFVNSVDDEGESGIPMEYQQYGAFTQGMIEKLYEIAETHGLILFGELVMYDNPVMFLDTIADEPFLDSSITVYQGYRFESGTFQFDAQYEGTWLQFRSSRKGVFDTVYAMVGDINDFTEWSFVNIHGTNLNLSQSTDRSYIIADTETAFIVISIRAGTQGDEWNEDIGSFGRSELEHFANLIDFTKLN